MGGCRPSANPVRARPTPSALHWPAPAEFGSISRFPDRPRQGTSLGLSLAMDEIASSRCVLSPRQTRTRHRHPTATSARSPRRFPLTPVVPTRVLPVVVVLWQFCGRTERLEWRVRCVALDVSSHHCMICRSCCIRDRAYGRRSENPSLFTIPRARVAQAIAAGSFVFLRPFTVPRLWQSLWRFVAGGISEGVLPLGNSLPGSTTNSKPVFQTV